MNRRDFLTISLAAGAVGFAVTASADYVRSSSSSRRFQLNYAPHFGMFRNLAGDDLLDQVRFIADEGFAAVEDNGLVAKPLDLQRTLCREIERRGLRMGVFVGHADFGNPTFASGRNDLREKVIADVRTAAETARRANARWCSIVAGKFDGRISLRRQTANVVETMKHCVDVCEPAGLVMLLEPIDHGGGRPRLAVHTLSQAVEICRAVDSAHCKVLFDVYQQHAAGYDVLAQIERHWPQFGYFQVGDSPGRKEPGTGDIDFRAIFRRLREKGYDGIVGMEHGNSLAGAPGERAVIDAYVRHDRF